MGGIVYAWVFLETVLSVIIRFNHGVHNFISFYIWVQIKLYICSKNVDCCKRSYNRFIWKNTACTYDDSQDIKMYSTHILVTYLEYFRVKTSCI